MIIAVIFGGKSCEHDISVSTGRMVMTALRHKVVPVYIDGDGTFYTGNIPETGNINVSKLKKVWFKPNDKALYCGKKALCYLDAAIICLHGLNGEDGSMSGLLQLAGIPYVGPTISAASVALDKIMMKKLFAALDFKITPYFVTDKYEFVSNNINIGIKAQNIGFPLIVKPASLGSSIGIGIAHDNKELMDVIAAAFEWDTRLVIEQALTDFNEYNCAIMGYGNEYYVSETEQPVGWKDYLSYSDKYGRGFKQGRKFPAPIDRDLKKQITDITLRCYKELDCGGIARLDFLCKDGELFVNEINTVPGSLAYYLFSDKFSFTALLDKLIEFALQRFRDFSKLNFRYESPLNSPSKG